MRVKKWVLILCAVALIGGGALLAVRSALEEGRVQDQPQVQTQPQDQGQEQTHAQPQVEPSQEEPPQARTRAQVAILMYHSFTENEEERGDLSVLAADFEAQLQALREAGYTSVTYQQLIDFVAGEGGLPDKPVVLTIDDGYQDNLDLAAPLLEEYGFTANIAVIGVSIGKDTYKDTGKPMTPHFPLEEALPWVEKGVLTVTTHSYNMHKVASLDGEGCRQGVLQMEGESDEAYIRALTQDYQTAVAQLEAVLGEICPVYTYPNGLYAPLSEQVLRQLGVKVTVTTQSGLNCLERGEAQSLYLLRRVNVSGCLTAEDLLDKLEQYAQQLEE